MSASRSHALKVPKDSNNGRPLANPKSKTTSTRRLKYGAIDSRSSHANRVTGLTAPKSLCRQGFQISFGPSPKMTDDFTGGNAAKATAPRPVHTLGITE